MGFNDNGGWVDTGATSAHDDGGAEAGGWLNGDGAGTLISKNLMSHL